MSNDKYDLIATAYTDTAGEPLYNIRAKRHIPADRGYPEVQEGELGGQVYGEQNLGKEDGDNSWIYPGVQIVHRSAYVAKNSRVFTAKGCEVGIWGEVLNSRIWCTEDCFIRGAVNYSDLTNTSTGEKSIVYRSKLNDCIVYNYAEIIDSRLKRVVLPDNILKLVNAKLVGRASVRDGVGKANPVGLVQMTLAQTGKLYTNGFTTLSVFRLRNSRVKEEGLSIRAGFTYGRALYGDVSNDDCMEELRELVGERDWPAVQAFIDLAVKAVTAKAVTAKPADDCDDCDGCDR